jgi:transposase
MRQEKRSHGRGELSKVHPAAAAIDIDATIHVAAVGPDRAKDPVRTFQTFTADLNRMADWLADCGTKTVVMESTGGLLDSGLRDSRATWIRGGAGQRP